MIGGPLPNPKHERFARNIAAGMDQHAAYLAAGYAGNRTAACRLNKDPAVTIRIAALNTRATEKAVKEAGVTRADIAKQLEEDRAFAKERGNPSAMVAATMGKAKVLGLLIDKHEHSGPDGKPIETRNYDNAPPEVLEWLAGQDAGETAH